jgi:hypothetical protein
MFHVGQLRLPNDRLNFLHGSTPKRNSQYVRFGVRTKRPLASEKQISCAVRLFSAKQLLQVMIADSASKRRQNSQRRRQDFVKTVGRYDPQKSIVVEARTRKPRWEDFGCTGLEKKRTLNWLPCQLFVPCPGAVRTGLRVFKLDFGREKSRTNRVT